MAVLYSNTFDAETNGALTGWVLQSGGQFVVSNINDAGGTPVQGTKHFGQNSENYASRWEGGGVLGNQAIRLAQKYAASGSSVGALLRAQTTLGDRGVRMIYQQSGGNLRGRIDVRDNGSVSSQDSAYNIPVVVGDVVHLEARVSGNVFELRVWTNSNARPTTATVSLTSSFLATGYPALIKNGSSFEFSACDQLVITDAAGGEDFFYGPDTTPPTLTSPTGTQTGGTSASGTVSTNEGNGTLFRLASINATETVATVKAANITSTVAATGVQNVTFTGLSPSTTYFAHYVHRDAAGNDSARVSSASFTTTSGDSTAPTLTGSITVSALTATSYTLSWPAGADNIAVTSYERSLDGGTSWLDVGNVLTVSVTGRTAGATDVVRVRAKDGSGNVSAPALSTSVTLPLPTLVSAVVRNNTGTTLASTSIPKVAVLRLSDMALILNLTNQTTGAGGTLTIADASLVQGVGYVGVLANVDGTALGTFYGVAA
jgi:hypothetical protein